MKGFGGRPQERFARTLLRPQAPPAADGLKEELLSIASAIRIGDANKSRVIQTLFDLGPTSRADLARLSGAKRTTISGIVQPLIDVGLLIEEEPIQTGGVGKPARPLWFSADTSPVCAVMLMPDEIRSGMVSLRGEVYGVHSEVIAHEEGDQKRYLASMERCVSRSLSSARGRALGIGVAVDGMVDPETGSIVAMSLAPWLAGLELSRMVEERFGLHAIVDHHPRAILMGERWFGRGRGLKDFAVIYADEGLACSLFLNGQAFRGPHGSGGELGHTIVSVHGETCTCGRRGCWETIATLRWLRRRAASLGIGQAETLDVESLCALAEHDTACKDLRCEYAYNLAVGIANLQTLIMPDNFILYGGVARGSVLLLEDIRAFARDLAFSSPAKSIEINFGSPDQHSVALRGAAGLVISEELRIKY